MKNLSQIHNIEIMNSLSRHGGNILAVLNELVTGIMSHDPFDIFKYKYHRGHITPAKFIANDDGEQVESIMSLDEMSTLNHLLGRVHSLSYAATVLTDVDISDLITSTLEHDYRYQTDAFVHLDTFQVDEDTSRLTVGINDGPEIYTYVTSSINLPRVHLDNIMQWITSFDSKPESAMMLSNVDILNTFKTRLLNIDPNILNNIDELSVDIEEDTISLYHNGGLLTITLIDDAYTYLDRMLQVIVDWIERVVVDVE